METWRSKTSRGQETGENEGFPFKNFLMWGRVPNPPVRSRSQIVAGFNSIHFAQGQVQRNPDFNGCVTHEADGY